MVKSQAISASIKKIPLNQLIFSNEFYHKHFADITTEESYYKTLERLCSAGDLRKLAKGTYYRPKIGRYGTVPPSDQEIIKPFIEDDKGTVVGYKLYNTLNLTTQISKKIEILSSKLDQQTKTIRNVYIQHYDIDYTEENKNIIHMLDVLKNFDSIEDINYVSFISYSEKFSRLYRDESANYILGNIHHQKRTISFLREILTFYHVPNTLSNYLSSLSEYNHPTMEALYEAAYKS